MQGLHSTVDNRSDIRRQTPERRLKPHGIQPGVDSHRIGRVDTHGSRRFLRKLNRLMHESPIRWYCRVNSNGQRSTRHVDGSQPLLPTPVPFSEISEANEFRHSAATHSDLSGRDHLLRIRLFCFYVAANIPQIEFGNPRCSMKVCIPQRRFLWGFCS